MWARVYHGCCMEHAQHMQEVNTQSTHVYTLNWLYNKIFTCLWKMWKLQKFRTSGNFSCYTVASCSSQQTWLYNRWLTSNCSRPMLFERLSLRYVRDCLRSWPGSEVADSVVWVLWRNIDTQGARRRKGDGGESEEGDKRGYVRHADIILIRQPKCQRQRLDCWN